MCKFVLALSMDILTHFLTLGLAFLHVSVKNPLNEHQEQNLSGTRESSKFDKIIYISCVFNININQYII